MPVSNADELPNGYDVSCAQVNPNQVVCKVGGCPRVYENHAGGRPPALLLFNSDAGAWACIVTSRNTSGLVAMRPLLPIGGVVAHVATPWLNCLRLSIDYSSNMLGSNAIRPDRFSFRRLQSRCAGLRNWNVRVPAGEHKFKAGVAGSNPAGGTI